MQIIIYFDNKPLILCDTKTKEIEELLHHEETVFIDEFNVHTIKAMIHEMQLPKINAGVFLHDNLDELLKAFKKKFTLIQAAGGLVYTNEEEILLIFRRGKWDLPKGKLDEEEDLQTCALREIKEETGLVNIKSEGPLTITYHTYHQFGSHILKETHWYMVKSERQNNLIPQTGEDIEKCEWVKVENLSAYLSNTYALIHEVINKGLKILQKAV